MLPLISYLLKSYTRSQRYFAPFAGIVTAVLVLYSYKPNPVMNSYAATGVIFFAGCAFLGLSFLNHEHPIHRQLMIVHMRSARKYVFGGILSLALVIMILDFLIVIYPVLTGQFNERAGLYRVILALIGHGLLGLLGIAIALFLQSAWVPKRGSATGLMLGILILSIGGTQVSSLFTGLLSPFRLLLPPVAPVMNSLMNGDSLPFSGILISFTHCLLYVAVLITVFLYRSGHKDYGRI